MPSPSPRFTTPPLWAAKHWKHPGSRYASCFENLWKASNAVKTGKRSVCPRFFRFLSLALTAAVPAIAQTPAPASLTVGQAVERALKNYPAVRVSQEQINAAAAGIRLARTAYLPHADALAQVNRATRHNIYAM